MALRNDSTSKDKQLRQTVGNEGNYLFFSLDVGGIRTASFHSFTALKGYLRFACATLVIESKRKPLKQSHTTKE